MRTSLLHSPIVHGLLKRILPVALPLLVLVSDGAAQRRNLVLRPGATFAGTGTIIVKDSIQNGGLTGTVVLPGRLVLSGSNQWIGIPGAGGLRSDTLTAEGSGTKTFQVTFTAAESLTVAVGTTLRFNGDTLRIGKLSGGGGAFTGDAASVLEYTRNDGVSQALLTGVFNGKLRLLGGYRKTVGGAVTVDSLEHSGGLTVNAPFTVNGRAQVDTLVDIAAGMAMQFGAAGSTLGVIAANHGSILGGSAALAISGPGTNSGNITGGSGRVTFAGSLAHNLGTIAAGSGGMVFGNTVTLAGTALIRSTAAAESLAFNGAVTFTSATSSVTLTGTGVAAFAQTPSLSAPANLNLAAGSTVYYTGGSQTVPSILYGNLAVVNAGTKTLASGTTGIAGSMLTLNGAVLDAMTNGGTLDYNGTGAQTIAAFRYAGLSISGNKNGQNVTLAPDTLRIGGSFTNSATNAVIVNAGSTFEYAGSAAQTITAFPYFNLLLSGAGPKSLLASQTTNGDVTLEAGASLTVDVAAVWQIDGSLNPIGTFVNNGTITIGN